MSDEKYRASVGFSADVGCEKTKEKTAALIYMPLLSLKKMDQHAQ
jgi:hypothetical protein